MYLGPCRGQVRRVTAVNGLQELAEERNGTHRVINSSSEPGRGAAERNRSEINPAILGVFAHKSQFFQQNTATARYWSQRSRAISKAVRSFLFCGHLGDGQMRNVGPLLLEP